MYKQTVLTACAEDDNPSWTCTVNVRTTAFAAAAIVLKVRVSPMMLASTDCKLLGCTEKVKELLSASVACNVKALVCGCVRLTGEDIVERIGKLLASKADISRTSTSSSLVFCATAICK